MNSQRGYGEADTDRGSDARPVNRGGMVTLSRGELYDLTTGLQAKANRAFWRGVGFGGAVVAALAYSMPAFGETITIGGVWLNGTETTGTTVTIAPSDVPGQIAVVTMVNRYVNDGNDNGEYFLGIPGLVVGAVFEWDASSLGADKITVVPPEGLTCLPTDCTATVLEGLTGEVIILDWIGS